MRKLIIKAANGSVDDFKIDADLNWTVKEVKSHIYRHYPTHPPLTCQKLIYGGKLLLDHSTLSEVVPTSLDTPEEDGEPIVIHLVAYERSRSLPSSMSSSSGVQRSPSVSGGAGGGSSNSSQGETTDGTNRQPSVQEAGRGERANPPIPNQQTQRVPPLLVDPWLRHRAGGGGGAMVPNPAPLPPAQNLPMFAPGAGGGGGGGAAGPYPFPQVPQFYQSVYGAAYANQVHQWYYNYYQRASGFGGAAVAGEEVRDDQNPLDLPANPNEPNDLPEPDDQQDEVPVNGPGGLGMMAGGGGAGGLRQRDLVDYLYMFSMIGFLVLMAFLTGSLGRLLIFAAGLTFMLLNQAGFFSLQRRRQAAPRGGHAPPFRPDGGVAPQGGEEQQQQEGVDGGQEDGNGTEHAQDAPPPPQAAEGSEQPHPEAEQQATAAAVEDPQRPGALATILVFITSFFTSLVPQQRPDLQVN